MATADNGNELFNIINRQTENVIKEHNKVKQKLTLDAFRSLVNKTARDTGFAAHNQDVSIDESYSDNLVEGDPNVSYPPAAYPNPPDSKFKLGSIIVIYNNTKYIMALERGIGQRPQPMVAPTMQMLERMANQLLSEFSSRNFL